MHPSATLIAIVFVLLCFTAASYHLLLDSGRVCGVGMSRRSSFPPVRSFDKCLALSLPHPRDPRRSAGRGIDEGFWVQGVTLDISVQNPQTLKPKGLSDIQVRIFFTLASKRSEPLWSCVADLDKPEILPQRRRLRHRCP